MNENDVFNFCLNFYKTTLETFYNDNLDAKVFNLYYELCDFLKIKPVTIWPVYFLFFFIFKLVNELIFVIIYSSSIIKKKGS